MHHGDRRIMTLLGAGAVLLLAMAGCGGDSSGDPGGGDPPDTTGTTFDLASAAAALEVVADADSLFRHVRQTQSNETATVAALTWLQGSDRVAACGVSTDSTIWAEFGNGMLLEQTVHTGELAEFLLGSHRTPREL